MIDMDKGNLNKLVTNYPVELTPEEVENLSRTLSSVRTAREDDKTYTGEGFVNVNNTNNVISLTNEANEKLNQPIPTKVSDLTDSASYQTVSGMDEYLTKTSASENFAPLSITDDIESLKNASSDWNKVSAKLDTTAFSTVSGNYAFKNDLNDYYQKTETSSKTEITNALNTKVDNPSQQTGLLVYDGDISAWVSMPPDTTIVQGQGSITSNYESNSTYTISLLASAENALKKVVNKIDTTAVEQKYQTKDDMSNYLTTSDASTTYQPIGDYATTSDISDMATQTWVGQQGFYTKASADNDYAPKTITATVNTLTGASASWNEVSAISRIDSVLANKKDKQNELTFNGSATKTVTNISQDANGEITVTYEDIDLLPQEDTNVEITSEDNSVKVTETTDIQTNTKKFDLSVQDGGTTYSAGDAIDLTNDTISVKYGKGIEITTDNKLQLKVGKGLTIDNNTLELTIKDLETSITDFRDGDVIPVDGPSGIAKMSKDDLLRETAENARNGMVIEKVYEHNGVSASNYVVSNTTNCRGVCAPFKANTFDKIKLKVQCANATTLAVSIMDTSFNVLKSKRVPVEGTSEPYDVMIDWGEVITMNSSFYLDVKVPLNTDNTFLLAREINYEVCDNYAYKAYIYIKVSTNRFESQYESVNCEFLLSTGDVRIPNLVDTEPQRIQNLAPVMNPPIIYTAVQDLNNVRNYGVNVYPDHCFNTETMPNVKNDGLDHKYIRSKFGKNPHTGASYVQANDYEEENLSIDFVGENKKVTITTKHISLKASVQNGKKAFVLVIGDSQGMYGGGKLGYANGDGTAFWMYAAKLFDMDKADGATSDVIFLGSEKFRSWDNVAKNEMTYEYLGKERTIHAASESIGSWSINHFLHKATEYTFDGSKDANEVYTGSNPINPFYDYARVNEFDIFSINKWLERFRTLDDDGNRLTWGDPRIGTLISESSLKFINVCKPTHVICMLGRNTVVAPDAYGSVCDAFISAVKRDCPSAKIAMCLQPDMPGTFNGSNYPEVLAPSEATTIYKLNERANQFAIMRAIYNQCKERENDNVFIVPVWFSQPTMYGWNLSSITDFTMENKEKYVIQGDDFHPSGEAHKAWAYQLYCWVLHTMYIDSLNQ